MKYHGMRPATFAVSATALSLWFSPASLAASGSDIAQSGNGRGAPACSSCHGGLGQGQPQAGSPRLARLNAGYLVHELESFADGSRKSDIMMPVARALSVEDRQAVAAYYANLQAPQPAASSKPDGAALKAGAEIALQGEWSKNLPACRQCHGSAGLGVGTAFPRLAGQGALYIINQIDSWKKGERKNDPMGLMAAVAAKLTTDEAEAVAAYYANLSSANNSGVTAGGAQ